MEDPVIDCLNHTYERHAIETALLHRPGFCPMTNERYPGGDAKLHSNLALRQTIEAMVPLTQRPAHDVSDGGGRERPRGETRAQPSTTISIMLNGLDSASVRPLQHRRR